MNGADTVPVVTARASWPDRAAARFVLAAMRRWRAGAFTLVLPDGDHVHIGEPERPPEVTVTVRAWTFFRRVLAAGDIGVAESYMAGEFTASDLVTMCALFLRDQSLTPHRTAWTLPKRAWHRALQWARANTPRGSRRNIVAHYDLSNDLYRLFLDDDLLYSCAVYAREDESLEAAQRRKMDQICRQLGLQPGMEVLDIGCGWGAMALHVAGTYGCRVTGLTLSNQQLTLARERVAAAGLSDRVRIELCDYRHARGRYDRIVSIEMFEAVGFKHYDEFFGACDRLLKPDGTMILQTITMLDQKFHIYRKRCDWIQKYIFPGSELASVSGILRSLARATRLSPFHLEDIGTHYARTLAAWRERFHASLPAVRKLGFDDRFIRMWDFYLAYCQGAFLERHIGDVQLLLGKNHNPRPLFDEPWTEEERAADLYVRGGFSK